MTNVGIRSIRKVGAVWTRSPRGVICVSSGPKEDRQEGKNSRCQPSRSLLALGSGESAKTL